MYSRGQEKKKFKQFSFTKCEMSRSCLCWAVGGGGRNSRKVEDWEGWNGLIRPAVD